MTAHPERVWWVLLVWGVVVCALIWRDAAQWDATYDPDEDTDR